MIYEIIVMSPAGAEAGGGGEGIEFGRDGSTRFIKGSEHGAADISGVRGWNDGIVHRDDPADGDIGRGGSGGAGIGHDAAALDDGGAEEFGHFGTDFGEVGFFFLGLGRNGFGAGGGLLTHDELGWGWSEFTFEELEDVFSIDDATGVEIGDCGEHVIDLRSGAVAGFEEVFGVHEAGRKCSQSLIWCLFLMK